MGGRNHLHLIAFDQLTEAWAMLNTTDFHTLLLSTSDIQGGAGRAAYRLHTGLQRIGVDSQMLSFQKTSGDITVHKLSNELAFQQTKLSVWVDKHPLSLYRKRAKNQFWSLNWFPNRVAQQINRFEPQIVHLHWIGNGFVPVQALKKIKSPIVWTLHDMWAFTGGCHYAGTCVRYEQKCGACPQLGSRRGRDLSRWTLERKKRHWRGVHITVVTPSQWLASCVRSSFLLRDARVEVIPNGLDLNLFKPLDKTLARDLLRLPQDKKLILAGANEGLRDKRKGVEYLQPALQQMAATWIDHADLVVFGGSRPAEPKDFGLRVHYVGHLHDDISLALLYSAADVFVAPSLQDNLPNTVMESLACGTPAVAFNIGGMPDMIQHQNNGYLAGAYDVNDLINGITWVLEDETRHSKLALAARQGVTTKYDLEMIAQRHLTLYHELLANHP